MAQPTGNPNVDERSNTTTFVGPISDDGTELTSPVYITGTVIFSNLPTSNPGVVGQLWSNAGVLTLGS